MSAIIARMHRAYDERLGLSEIRERFLAYDETCGKRSQVRVRYDMEAGAYRVWTSWADAYEPITPGYQVTSWGIWHTGVEIIRPGRLECGSIPTRVYKAILEDLANDEAEEEHRSRRGGPRRLPRRGGVRILILTHRNLLIWVMYT